MTTLFTVAAIAIAALAAPADGNGDRQTGMAPVLASQDTTKPGSRQTEASLAEIKPGTPVEHDRVRKDPANDAVRAVRQ